MGVNQTKIFDLSERVLKLVQNFAYRSRTLLIVLLKRAETEIYSNTRRRMGGGGGGRRGGGTKLKGKII
jgi:hypothetical protein